MYRRYSRGNDSTVSLNQMKRSRIKDLIILVLLILLAVSLVIGIPAVQSKNGNRAAYIQRAQSECDEAIRQISLLSRNAGADSASQLARIRSNLYAIRVISSMNTSENGGPLVAEDRILDIQNTVDRYLTYLTTGMDTGEYQTTLQNAMEELQEELSRLG
ncbi:MAG: hypothetical protein ABTB30_05745 [Clostridia bacterium]